MVAVSAAEVRRRIQPVVDAGFAVEGVLTPALALAAIARAQHGAAQGSAGAYVVLTARATCAAIVRDGLLLFAREMPWGYESDVAPDGVGARLASELRRSVLFFKQTFRAPVDHVVLCCDCRTSARLTATPRRSAEGRSALASLAGSTLPRCPTRERFARSCGPAGVPRSRAGTPSTCLDDPRRPRAPRGVVSRVGCGQRRVRAGLLPSGRRRRKRSKRCYGGSSPRSSPRPYGATRCGRRTRLPRHNAPPPRSPCMERG